MRNLVANRQPGDHIVFSCKLRNSVEDESGVHAHSTIAVPVSGHGNQVLPTNDKNERDELDEGKLLPFQCTI